MEFPASLSQEKKQFLQEFYKVSDESTSVDKVRSAGGASTETRLG